MADDGARLNKLRGRPNSDQHNHSRHNRNWRCRVHRDAQRTAVGITVQWVYMRHLDNGQQCQQGQT
jgi:hypothetical protein